MHTSLVQLHQNGELVYVGLLVLFLKDAFRDVLRVQLVELCLWDTQFRACEVMFKIYWVGSSLFLITLILFLVSWVLAYCVMCFLIVVLCFLQFCICFFMLLWVSLGRKAQ